jgi:hypothetical protein
MRIGLAIVIPAVLTLTVAGSTLAGTAAPAAAAHISTAHLLADGSGSAVSGVYYHA